ncbi:bifunctional transaldolase/phosoglucose isomerase [Chelatococcus reniformis]|uniref:Transaldolase n=1 Tax=Chelatococcus reniformis TaxID=1494448 RepID=A0A916X9T1_9HYPH|nr:bifunctional transaldolase/phosoglucose isomerase [Chelatococcus reniformis]GGC54401.1 glucose-6-phosphate isomerase [Chelatococcus reniformis]
MNPLKSLPDHGQAAWLDFLARGFIDKGDLARLVAEDGLRGVTSNPSIFEKAIADTDEYSQATADLLGQSDLSVMGLYEHLAMADIRKAADVLRPVYDATGGADGYVSLEVSPYLALETEPTVEEARRFWKEVDRPNLMVKVPATKAGIPAIRTLIGDGININVTLLFSQEVYEEVAKAYIAGLEALAAKGGDVSRVASVASFFISRIDVAVDKLLDQAIAKANDPDEKARLAGLKGKVAIANAKLAYRRYQRLFNGGFAQLKAKGAHAQRLLWASTGTKNKAYSDVLYVEELIGPNTVNTMPPATMDAFRDHGRLRNSLEENVGEAEAIMAALAKAGISIEAVADELVSDGVKLFADAADKLLGAVARRRITVLGAQLNTQTTALPQTLADGVAHASEAWRSEGSLRRLWHRDAAVWTGKDEAKWLDWLTLVPEELKRVDELVAFQREVAEADFDHVLLIGMGGSSLGPEVLAETFGAADGYPALTIIDSTDPEQIAATEAKLDLRRTLFIVSSKSGSTLEPNILKDYFFDKVGKALGRDEAGSRFVAVTDPGSSMEKTAKADGFWRVFYGLPGVGGRYSVLSRFGLVPAAAIGINVEVFLKTAQEMVYACGPDVPPADNPGATLGLVLGTAANAGRDKVTLIASPGIATFGAWAEQLLAESTGKQGKGLIPVDGEPEVPIDAYAGDRVFIYLRLTDGSSGTQDAFAETLRAAGHPVVRIDLASRDRLAEEFFRFEIATAVAGAVIGINAFDQPDVEASKIKTRELSAAIEQTGHLPQETPTAITGPISVFSSEADREQFDLAAEAGGLAEVLRAHLGRAKAGDYVAILAYVARNPAHHEVLQKARKAVLVERRVATCLGFGPRFLHSTGQAYKGGPNSGVFVQITADAAHDIAIPGRSLSFGQVEAAQAAGDLGVLAERGRRYLRLHISGDVAHGLATIAEAIEQAVARA